MLNSLNSIYDIFYVKTIDGIRGLNYNILYRDNQGGGLCRIHILHHLQ
jgi:hypothetical protein